MVGEKPCPICLLVAGIAPGQFGVENAAISFAVGVAFGHAVTDMHDVTERMCTAHRLIYVAGMLKALQLTSISMVEAKDA